MKVVLASHNAGKLRELNNGLQTLSLNIIPQSEFNIHEIEETGLTFIENALQKARHASRLTSLPAIADDSGLSVPALSYQPGIHSARYAGENANDGKNIDKLLMTMSELKDNTRMAYFYCIIVFIHHAEDPTPIIGEGKWWGKITETKQGESGFGYDPIFYVPSEKKTAAELSLIQKNKISHRGQALQALIRQLSEQIK